MEAKVTITATATEFDLVRSAVEEAKATAVHNSEHHAEAAIRNSAKSRAMQLGEVLRKLR